MIKNKELYSKQTTEKMMSITRHMLQNAFIEAFYGAYGANWFNEFKQSSKEHATNDEGVYIRSFDIVGEKSSVKGLDFSACIKTIIYLDEYRKKLLSHFKATLSEKAIVDVCHKLIAYRNYASSAHENDEDKPDFVITSEACMENLKYLAGFFYSVVNPETGKSYKDELEKCYYTYKNETNKIFYAFDDVFDISIYPIDTYIKAANHCGIPVFLSDKLLKQGFESYDLEKDKARIIRAAALINENNSASYHRVSNNNVYTQNIPAAPSSTTNINSNYESDENIKTSKLVLFIISIIIFIVLVSIIVFSCNNRSRTVYNGSNSSSHIPEKTYSNNQKPTEPQVVGEQTYGDKLHFTVTVDPNNENTLLLNIKNEGEKTYSFSQRSKHDAYNIKLTKIYLNNIDINKPIVSEEISSFFPIDLSPGKDLDPISIPNENINAIKYIRITNISYEEKNVEGNETYYYHDVSIDIHPQ